MRLVGETAAAPFVTMGNAAFPAPFASGLEYSVPARGGWTIVHVGMLLPEAHEIFVCAAGCLRGVVLSAAEMNMSDRFSTISIEEHNVLDGDMEELITDGVTDILDRLPRHPKAVLVYSSCIHHFMGCDLEMCYRTLRERFPDVDFTDCYMIPTMRKSGLTPDQIMRRQLYSLLRPMPMSDKHCAVIGSCFSMDETSDLMRIMRTAGMTVHQITECRTYEEYLDMARCGICVSTLPAAKAGGDELARRLGMKHLYLPVSYGADEIHRELSVLAGALGVAFDTKPIENDADSAMRRAHEIIGNTPVALDYTFTPRPLGLTRLLIGYGFNVERIFADSFSAEEKADREWLSVNAPQIGIYPTVDPKMRVYSRGSSEKTLALGQKSAYFTDSPYFVNMVENGGMYGFDGIKRLAEMMIDAYLVPKDVESSISVKGLGCESCI